MQTLTKIPTHLAMILDGNGRWAIKRGLARTMGHREGARRLIENIKYAFSLNIKVVSVFLFSTQNWKRPKEEIDYLFSLPKEFFDEHLPYFIENKIKVVVSGEIDALPLETQQVLKEAMAKTRAFDNQIFNLAMNYGGRDEIIHACKRIACDYKANKIQLKDINEENFESYFYFQLPPIDLMIRTSNEQRISNFMLWQLSYAELMFVKTLWPAFMPKHLYKAIQKYGKRNRRFGGLSK